MANIVTRNIKTQVVAAKLISMSDYQLKDVIEIVPRNIQNDEARLAYITERNSGFKAIAILNVEITEQMYGMTEDDFVRFGKAIEKRSEVK